MPRFKPSPAAKKDRALAAKEEVDHAEHYRQVVKLWERATAAMRKVEFLVC